VKLTKVAAILTVVMAVLNLPTGFTDDRLATAAAWGLTVAGIVGLIAGVGALRGAGWGPPAVLAIGSVNLAAAVASLFADLEGAVVGIVINGAIVAAMVPFVAAGRRNPSAIATSR